MSPASIKKLRKRLDITQKSMAEAFGVSTLSMSQYETKVRNPGPTAHVFFAVLDSIPKTQALDLLKLFRSRAVRLKKSRARSGA